MTVKQGDTIKVSYEGKLEDGTVFDSSQKHGQPLQFKVGEKQVIPGFEQGVEGMQVGEKKDITIPPEKAYGNFNEQLIQVIPKEKMGSVPDPKVGMTIGVALPNGQQFPAKITKVEEKDVTLDLNHPLAGKTLTFSVTVEEIVE
ncbi:MAG: FKBP-type peptidyl-prolyl cis-trans isomerase [Candidatus Woesearchaeota archaeon]